MAVSGTGKCLSRLYPVLLLLQQSKRPQCRLCFISAINYPAQPLQAGFWASLVPYHNFKLRITFSCQSIPCHPHNVNISDTTSHFQPAKFLILFGMNFCEQQLVLGKLSNTVKWSTFCVSFICMLTILGWLQCFKIFKINYFVTSNVRFHKSSHICTYM